MIVSELIEALEAIIERQDSADPDVYIRIGLHQVSIKKIEYFPETEDEFEAVVIS